MTKSIVFFNHLSSWVITLILTNSKPKHRARMYERFMYIAQHLRQLNDYETLYAVTSGMRDTSVQRLSQTHQLVQVAPSVAKEFQGYVKLFDPGGGYAHYRRALQANVSNGQAAIPLM